MRYLLDTHILLQWLADDKKLEDSKKEIIANPNNIIFVSAANIWAIEIKRKLGKLKMPNKLNKIIDDNDFVELPININHIAKLKELDDYHSDPFDRLLVAQCLAEKCALLTSNKTIKKYPIKTY